MKSHIFRRTPAINQQLQGKFGVSLSTINKAMKGDVTEARKLGKLADEARIASTFAEPVAQAAIAIFQGTADLAKAQKDIAVAAANSTSEINKAQIEASAANLALNHNTKELYSAASRQIQQEKQRHKMTMATAAMSHYIAVHTQSINSQVQMAQLENQVPLQQINADRQYNEQQVKAYLSANGAPKAEMMPTKQYQTEGFMSGFNRLKSALGFG